jgi:putative component of membrane protein insertase Oxa1/YidC/SpoIIIJ protein YidD
MRTLLLAAIAAYQHYLSPHKGFCCAYRVHTGRQSCSALGFRAVRRYGVLTGLGILRRRVFLCGVAHRRYSPPHKRPHRSQRGDCDLPCDLNCDLPGSDACSSLGDVANGCDCGSCDWPDRKRKKSDEEKYMYIPPNSGNNKTGGSARAGEHTRSSIRSIET